MDDLLVLAKFEYESMQVLRMLVPAPSDLRAQEPTCGTIAEVDVA